jgi:hypothetical protein
MSSTSDESYANEKSPDAAADNAQPTTDGLTVVFSEATYNAVQKLAERRDKTVSEYIREALALQKWFDNKRAAGWRILTEKGGRVREVLKIR